MTVEEEMAEALAEIEAHVQGLSFAARADGAQRAMQSNIMEEHRAGDRKAVRASELWSKSEWLIDNGYSMECGMPVLSYGEWAKEKEEMRAQAEAQHELNEQARKAKARESGRRQREKKKLREIEELRRELEETHRDG